MPKRKRVEKEVVEDSKKEVEPKSVNDVKIKASDAICRFQWYSRAGIKKELSSLDPKLKIQEDNSITNIEFADGRNATLVFSKIDENDTHICTPGYVSVDVNNSPLVISPKQTWIFLAPFKGIYPNWTPETSFRFPKEFKDAIYTLLLCNSSKRLGLTLDFIKLVFTYLKANDFILGKSKKDEMYFCIGNASLTRIMRSNFELNYLLSPTHVKEILNTKLERCWKNKYGAWFCKDKDKKSKSKFIDYP